jgi:hypothetical protein
VISELNKNDNFTSEITIFIKLGNHGISDMSVVRVKIKKNRYNLLSSDEIKTYDHITCDVKVKIVIDFSYLNDMDLSVFIQSDHLY